MFAVLSSRYLGGFGAVPGFFDFLPLTTLRTSQSPRREDNEQVKCDLNSFISLIFIFNLLEWVTCGFTSHLFFILLSQKTQNMITHCDLLIWIHFLAANCGKHRKTSACCTDNSWPLDWFSLIPNFVNIFNILKDLDTDSPNLWKRKCTNDSKRIWVTQELQILSGNLFQIQCSLNKLHKPQPIYPLISSPCCHGDVGVLKLELWLDFSCCCRPLCYRELRQE